MIRDGTAKIRKFLVRNCLPIALFDKESSDRRSASISVLSFKVGRLGLATVIKTVEALV
jgi:hypothetical protein